MPIPVKRFQVVNTDFQRQPFQRDGKRICAFMIRVRLGRYHWFNVVAWLQV